MVVGEMEFEVCEGLVVVDQVLMQKQLLRIIVLVRLSLKTVVLGTHQNQLLL